MIRKLKFQFTNVPLDFFSYNHVLFDCASQEQSCSCIPCSRFMKTIRVRDCVIHLAYFKVFLYVFTLHITVCLSMESVC